MTILRYDTKRDKKKEKNGKVDLGKTPGFRECGPSNANKIDAETWRTAGPEIRQRNFSCNGDEEGW